MQIKRLTMHKTYIQFRNILQINQLENNTKITFFSKKHTNFLPTFILSFLTLRTQITQITRIWYKTKTRKTPLSRLGFRPDVLPVYHCLCASTQTMPAIHSIPHYVQQPCQRKNIKKYMGNTSQAGWCFLAKRCFSFGVAIHTDRDGWCGCRHSSGSLLTSEGIQAQRIARSA